MNTRIIKALLKKDSVLFTSNRFYLLITVVGIIFYIGTYFILPSKVDEKLRLAMYAPVVSAAFNQLTNQEGVEIEFFPSQEAVKQSVLVGDYQIAIALPADIIQAWEAGAKPQITIYYASSAPVELKDAIAALVKELSFAQTGQALKFDTTEEILGPDMFGAQIALRDRMRPLLAVFILLVEIMTLASLISGEIEQGTVRALLVSPMRISDLFIAKGILGVGLALVQAILFMALVGGFDRQPVIVMLTLLIGSLMVVGTGFLLASLARDVNAVTGWGVLVLIILAIPGFGSVIPGLLSEWAKVIPSYYLTDTINRALNYDAGWSDIWLNLFILLSFTSVVIWGGMTALRRRYR
jgi:ABC-2 type transport system permease protein